ncbi:hypothetical protein [Streptomyces sp. TLI_171]|uniref:hypothetical protein n=1 Tax=Streptomyces sp. TLI_171 TaxID=1938859 RepID=UPI000E74EAC3|nr:hypothetical protein [Streptomyces sp. TLI_171]RKE22128.1 hypothetical protein BX266_5555 [Streptomyces sp. TLI_171]
MADSFESSPQAVFQATQVIQGLVKKATAINAETTTLLARVAPWTGLPDEDFHKAQDPWWRQTTTQLTETLEGISKAVNGIVSGTQKSSTSIDHQQNNAIEAIHQSGRH